MNSDGLKACSRVCLELNESCPNDDCRMWIDYEDELFTDIYLSERTNDFKASWRAFGNFICKSEAN
jgi:hypothetical protein